TLYLTQILNPERFRMFTPLSGAEINPHLQDDQGWDNYWREHKHAGGILYDTVAAFYRKFIIKRTLNYFVSRYFAPGAQILHAGCGSGQVDTDIAARVSITGLDISVNALNFFRRTLQGKGKVLHGSIFQIPLPDQAMDGIYNLGVMEHFSETEIHQILKEFRRVLKPGGRVIAFWPPEFGLSVLFFKALTWFFKTILRRQKVKFHPDEITRVRSRRHVTEIFKNEGFDIVRYYFGPKDVFTYSIIVAERPGGATKSAPVLNVRTNPQGLLV
ncbi:MAG: methyltransferase domain-containing protein, partial [Bdellovibrionota bacterium]